MSDIAPDTRIRVPEHVAHRPFGDDTVLLNLRTGQYHGLNPTAGHMFELLAEYGRPDAAAQRAAAEYSAPVETVAADMVELCEQLLARGLIETV